MESQQIKRFEFVRRHPGHFLLLVLMILLHGSAQGQVQLTITPGPQPLISVSGPNGQVQEIQWSDALTNAGRWFYLTNRVLGSPVQVTDSNPPLTGARFYRAVRVPSENMVLIPGGSFMMGDTYSEGFSNEQPVHGVTVSPYYMERTEVRRADWDAVYLWASTHGYTLENSGGGKGPTHPIHSVSWFDAVKWCNARSEMEGLTPLYYTESEQTNVYRVGRVNLSQKWVRWSADGYRLPTEAEWERAARSGESGWRFPWGGEIRTTNANYLCVTYLSYDKSGINGFNPLYAVPPYPYTSPVGSFPATAFGLHDMIGNVWEWCWDRFDPSWYQNPAASQLDTRGSEGPTTNRVMRGGSWTDDASYGRCANRAFSQFQAPSSADFSIGLRCVMAVPGYLSPASLEEASTTLAGQFRFKLYNLTPGKTNIIEASTDLVAWSGIATNVPTLATMAFTNTPGAGVKARFYRSRQLP